MRVHIVTYNDSFVAATATLKDAQAKGADFVARRSGRYSGDLSYETVDLDTAADCKPVEPVEFDPRKFAETCIERMAALGFKGKKRDDACLDYYIGAAVALEQAGVKEAAGIIRTQAVLIVSVRGFIGVGGIAHRLPA